MYSWPTQLFSLAQFCHLQNNYTNKSLPTGLSWGKYMQKSLGMIAWYLLRNMEMLDTIIPWDIITTANKEIHLHNTLLLAQRFSIGILFIWLTHPLLYWESLHDEALSFLFWNAHPITQGSWVLPHPQPLLNETSKSTGVLLGATSFAPTMVKPNPESLLGTIIAWCIGRLQLKDCTQRTQAGVTNTSSKKLQGRENVEYRARQSTRCSKRKGRGEHTAEDLRTLQASSPQPFQFHGPAFLFHLRFHGLRILILHFPSNGLFMRHLNKEQVICFCISDALASGALLTWKNHPSRSSWCLEIRQNWAWGTPRLDPNLPPSPAPSALPLSHNPLS